MSDETTLVVARWGVPIPISAEFAEEIEASQRLTDEYLLFLRRISEIEMLAMTGEATDDELELLKEYRDNMAAQNAERQKERRIRAEEIISSNDVDFVVSLLEHWEDDV